MANDNAPREKVGDQERKTGWRRMGFPWYVQVAALDSSEVQMSRVCPGHEGEDAHCASKPDRQVGWILAAWKNGVQPLSIAMSSRHRFL